MSTEYIEDVNVYLKSIEDQPEYIEQVDIWIKNIEWSLCNDNVRPDQNLKIMEEERDHWSIKLRRQLRLRSLGL
jgi:hypothetical protein